MNDNQKRIFGVASGVAIGFLVTVGGFAVLLTVLHLISNPGRYPALGQLTVVGVPEIIFVIAAVLLWKTKRPVAIGILATAVLLATHVVMHVASHGMPQ